jgi:peptidyl-prolyl cis-trans isomerase D
MRKNAGGWIAKILFILLIASFALWGVADWTTGMRREKLAEVGGREISQAEFERAYQNQITMLSNQLGRQVTSAEARALGLTQRVLQNLVGAAAINIHAEQLGLGLSDDAIAESIRNEEAFHGPDGKFSRSAFDEVLRANGLNEAAFVDMQRRELVRGQIVGALTEAPYAPQALAEAIHRFRNDERTVKYFILPPESAGALETPSEDALKAHYENNKRSFTVPELRRAGLLILSPDRLKSLVTISDEELKAAYEAGKKAFSVPERRTIQQLIFKDRAAAEEASRKLAAGADFMQIGKEIGMKETDINLGAFAQEEFANPRAAEAAFKLEKGGVSGVVEGFAPVIVRVTEITPGSEKSFEEVKDQVRDQLVKSRASDDIAKLYDQIEDERAAGSSLSELAKKLTLEFKEITVNRQGADREGKPVAIPVKAADVVKLIFESDVGVENNPLPLDEQSYAFVDVLEVIPERQRAFDEVREEVAKGWAEEETRARLAKKADELIAALNRGQSIVSTAQSVGAEVKTSASLKRSGAEPGLPLSAVAQAFTLPQDGFGSAQMPDRKGRVIFQVAAITPAPPLDDKQTEELRAEIARGTGNDLMAQYLNGLQTAYGVQINANAINNATAQTQ